MWMWRARGPRTHHALWNDKGLKNENANTETLNCFKAGVSLIPLLSRQRPSFVRTNRARRVEEVLSAARNRGVFSVLTTQRHVGLRVLHSITRHLHWKRLVWRGPRWCSYGPTLCTQTTCRSDSRILNVGPRQESG